MTRFSVYLSKFFRLQSKAIETIAFSAISGVFGILNMLAVILVTRTSSAMVEKTDFLYFTLAACAFVIPIIAGPVTAGLVQYLKSRDLSFKDFESQLFSFYFSVLSGLVLLFIVLLIFAIYFSGYLPHNNWVLFLFVLFVSIIYELLRIIFQINNQFSKVLILQSVNIFTFIASLTGMGVEDFLLFSIVLKVIVFICLVLITISTVKNIDLLAGWESSSNFYSQNFVYSGVSFISTLSAFTPALIFNSSGAGFVTIYYASLRLSLAPVSLFVTPLIDFLRFRVYRSGLDRRAYLMIFLMLLSFSFVWICTIFVFRQDVIEILLPGYHDKKVASDILGVMIVLTLTQSLWVLNTRFAEVSLDINRIAFYGVFGHIAFIICAVLSISSAANYIPIARVLIDLFWFSSVGFYFIYMSNRLIKIG